MPGHGFDDRKGKRVGYLVFMFVFHLDILNRHQRFTKALRRMSGEKGETGQERWTTFDLSEAQEATVALTAGPPERLLPYDFPIPCLYLLRVIVACRDRHAGRANRCQIE